MTSSLSRRRLLQIAGTTAAASATGPLLGTAPAHAAVVPPVRADIGALAHPFALGQVRLTASRWLDNQNRTASYLRFVDVDRLLYTFRANHRLSTAGAAATGGWEAPDFPFRSHVQGHFLTAWAQLYAVTGDTVCRDKATYMVAELAKCQANNSAAGFTAGYLSGYPEADFTALEARTLNNGNVPYYTIHKTLTGLLDVWRHLGSTQARDVLLALAGWVDTRTGRLTAAQTQAMLGTEFGGMNAVLTDLYQQTGDARWLTVARRFDHAAVFDPGRRPGPARRSARQHPGTEVDRRGTGVQGHRHHPLPRHRHQRLEHLRGHPHLRHRRQQPGRALPRPERHRRIPAPGHLRELQHRQHAHPHPRTVRPGPEPGRALRLLRAGMAQPHDRPAEPGRPPRPRHLLHPLNPGGRRGVGPAWEAAPGAPTTPPSGAARAPAWRYTPG